MKLSPSYGVEVIQLLDRSPTEIRVPMLRQRRRFSSLLEGLSPEQWAAPSRCEGWRVQDVAAHLAVVDRFWLASIDAGLAGSPSRMLAEFDPQATPAAMVNAVGEATVQETLTAYRRANGSLCSRIESLAERDWESLAETPTGHQTVSVLAHHALWDSWVHERDVCVPLGIAQDEQIDEICASLRYAAALGPAYAQQLGQSQRGALLVAVTEPTIQLLVTVGDDVRVTDNDAPPNALVVEGRAVEVLEALSVRRPWGQPIPDDQAWLVGGLLEAFK